MGRPIEIEFSEREIRRVIAEHLPRALYFRLQTARVAPCNL